MASYSYSDFRHVLRHYGFELVRTNKHEWWRKEIDGRIYQVAVSLQYHETIGKKLFHLMLNQANLTEETFRKGL